MIKQRKISKGAVFGLLGVVALLGLIILLENLSGMLPSVPAFLLPTSQLFVVLKKTAVYGLVAVSMNLLNGFTGLFSLGQAGFMLLGAYTYAILTVPMASKDQVYYLFGGSAVRFSLPDLFGGMDTVPGLLLGTILGILLAGCVASVAAWLIGLPVLRLKSDYLAIATLGFAEIIRAIFQWQKLGSITNGANMLKNFPIFSNFNIKNADGQVILRLSTFVPFLVASVCILLIVMLINSSYGRAFKAIREDEIAAEAMGVNLFKHKQMSFCISSFFTGIAGALFAMYATNAQAKPFTSAMTYEILLIVVIGGIGSVSGSCIATFLYVACSEWWLRFLDDSTPFGSQAEVPLLRPGFRMVVFSVVIMVVVLFFRKGIMGNKELPDLFKKNAKKEVGK
ncbi:MAG: branched-chain amino acid ABC transporter permease [Oscillospiraceae bacterium]|nr:branched-chain amino acid ABC transporter permease [Oscillospiraceae bacterium]